MKNKNDETKIGNKTLKKLKQIQKLKDSNKKSKKKENTIKEHEYLNGIGEELAKKFTITQLIGASKGAGFEVHGFLQTNYIDYEWLIDNYILDRAVFFSKKANVPEILKITDRIDIEQFHRTVIICKTPLILNNMANMHIKKIILYSEKPFNSAITFIDQFEWELDGYDTKINLGPANLGVIGYLVNEILLCVLLHAPGQNQGLADVIFETKGTLSELNDLVKRYVFEHRQKEKKFDEILEEKDIERNLAEKMYSDLKKTNLEHYIGSERDFRNFEEDRLGVKKSKKSMKRRKIIFGILTALGLVAAFTILTIIMNGGF